MEVVFAGRGDSVTAPKVAGDLFRRGVQALFRNFNAGRGHPRPAGLAGVCDEAAFIGAVRGLTDAIYAATGSRAVEDVSPGNAEVRALIEAVYADDVVAPAPTTLVAPVFVVGVPRSGTTWVANMLRAHPALDGPDVETALFVSLQPLWNNAALRDWISDDALARAIRGFVSTVLAPWGPRVVEKTPLHAEHLPLIATVFPDASIVSVHRDGRDVVRSLLEMEAGTDDVVVAATRWSEITREVSAALPSLAHACDLRYESLLADPVAGVVDLFAWLGLAVDDDVRATVARRAGERVSQYNTTGEVGAGKWRSLSRKQLRAVYRHAGDRLDELGYTDR
ncbi:MAG TPA: sulfotransferase [Acidimicrobiales bacterium]|nr:sulfotransferase [Acidimicrobiales bacterium]